MASLLALDTSTERLVIALQHGERTSGVDEAGGASASARLLPAARELLARAGIRFGALDAIAFGRGPGAFTGLRTACAVAQGLALGTGKPVLAIDSLLIVAEDARQQLAPGAPRFDGWVAMDARMGEVYAAAYRWRDGRWSADVAPALFDLDTLHARWLDAAPAVVAGTALTAFGERLSTGGATCVPTPRDRPRALAALALAAWQAGDVLDAAQALPLYLRDKVALTSAERAAGMRLA